MKHYNIFVKGKVQGVNFRARTKERALQLGIRGFVKNEEDGSVYIEAEGDEDQIEALLEWCGEGPEKAIVKQIFFEIAPIENFKDFNIRY